MILINNVKEGGGRMMRSIRIRFTTTKEVNFLELGIPLELLRKKRALEHQSNSLHFDETTLKILRHSNAHTLIGPTSGIK